MRADLVVAMKARDATAVRALRTALAAVANAEAPPLDSLPAPVSGRSNEHARLDLSVDDVEAVLRHEITDRHDTIARLLPHDRPAEVAELRAEIAVLQGYVG